MLTRLDPLSYGVDGLRGALTGVTQFGFGCDLAVLTLIAFAASYLGAWRFSKIEA